MTGKNFLYALIGLSLLLFWAAAGPLAEDKQPPAILGMEKPAAIPPAAIQVSFKVREITSQSTYMGELFVPNITTVDVGQEVSVEAKAVGLDAQNKQVDINPTWKAGNPSMIAIAPDQGARVKLTILKPGQSSISVTVGEISKKLSVKSWISEHTIYARITQ
jgi:hypothetical protein